MERNTLNNLAIAAGAVVFCKLGYLSVIPAIILALVCMTACAAVDKSKVFIGYGVICIIALVIFVPMFWFVEVVTGSTLTTPLETAACCYLGATAVKLFLLSSEGASNTLYDYVVPPKKPFQPASYEPKIIAPDTQSDRIPVKPRR